jgi:DNA (cytosine-5)-methyltransferase 1
MKIGTDFSGIGSPEMALKLLGIEHEQVFACEIDKYARKSHRAIYGEDYKLYEDITKRDHSEVEQLDLYVAGFPCQAFSMAGKRKGFEDTRGTLFFNVAEFIKINQPKCFILENVKGLLSHDGGKTFQTIISLLTDNGGTANGQMFIPYFEDGLGYHVYYKVLNTKDFGIPQNRERIFIVGFKEFREFRFPKPFSLELRLKDMLQDNPDYKYFLSDKLISYYTNNHILNKRKGNGFAFSPSYGNVVASAITTKEGSRMENNYLKIPSIISKQYAKSNVDDKYYLSDKMINTLFTKDSGKNNTFKKAELKGDDDIAQCLNHRIPKMGRGDNYIKDKYKIRRLTPLECFRLQGFPDAAFMEAQKVNSDTQLYKQAGNSITVNVMMELFKKIYETI